MITVKDIYEENKEEREFYYIHLDKAQDDEFDPLITPIWEGYLKDVPEEYMDYEVVRSGQSLADQEKGITGFRLEIKSQAKSYISLEEKKIDKLYELLADLKPETDSECIAALRWAIFELENKYCK